MPAPPADSRAECAVLVAVTLRPALVDDLGLQALDFYYPEYRALWQAMHALPRGLDAGAFYCDLINEVDRRECDGAHVGQPVSGCRTGQLLGLLDELSLQELAWELGMHSIFRELVPWAAGRVRACAEARRLIVAAQEMATLAWRGDIDGAVGTITRVFDGTEFQSVAPPAANTSVLERLEL